MHRILTPICMYFLFQQNTSFTDAGKRSEHINDQYISLFDIRFMYRLESRSYFFAIKQWQNHPPVTLTTTASKNIRIQRLTLVTGAYKEGDHVKDQYIFSIWHIEVMLRGVKLSRHLVIVKPSCSEIMV